jgi:hypothetical protein
MELMVLKNKCSTEIEMSEDEMSTGVKPGAAESMAKDIKPLSCINNMARSR